MTGLLTVELFLQAIRFTPAALSGFRTGSFLFNNINAGIYLIEPRAHKVIPIDQRFDMTDLIERLIQEGRRVVRFPITEYWLDIGRPEEYEQAQQDIKKKGLKR